MSLVTAAINAIESGRVPDSLTRMGIRKLLAERIRSLEQIRCEEQAEQTRRFIESCSRSSIAEVPEKANEQHYEVPAEFFRMVLGPRLKYSCCYWPQGVISLAEAEAAALRVTCDRAELQDGMQILELGCGWGSLSLWMAENYPAARIVAVSNSRLQRDHIEEQIRLRKLKNLSVHTADMNHFQPERTFDRVVSVEMFEHMRNHRELMHRIHGWLNPGGKLFVHLFCHRHTSYLFEDNGPQDWMTRYFFSGGMMPSDSLLLHYQQDLQLEKQWRWGGTHYKRTCDAWLELQDLHRAEVMQLFRSAYGVEQAAVWFHRWRVFFLACAELFGSRNGEAFWVSHYLFGRHSS